MSGRALAGKEVRKIGGRFGHVKNMYYLCAKKKNKIEDMFRNHTCGELRIADAGKSVTLAGWVQRVRKMGGMTFVDLRDRYGITQLVFNTDVNAELCERASHLGREYVIQVKGTVNERSSKNPNLPTGEVEITVEELTVLNSAQTPPFTIEDNTDGGDDLRMKYRYLDLRRTAVRKNLELRHRMTMEVRRYLDGLGFLEVETPMLIGSTPEGARDFVVPSRMNPGQFYALPQSPQTLKQLLMVSGFDRYFQIVKCFRDEDLRADRQPEFTQIDCEMSFVEQEDIIETFEGMAKHLFKELRGVELTEPFLRMPWADAMKYYGSDKPDLRFGMELVDVSETVKDTEFVVFKGALENGGSVRGINAKGQGAMPRKKIDKLVEFAKGYGAKGLAYIAIHEDGSWKSSFSKFMTEEQMEALIKAMDGQAGDLLLFAADRNKIVWNVLGALRLELAEQMGLLDKNEYRFVWITEFPLLEWSDEENRFTAMHHPFTMPMDEDLPLLDTDPGAVRAKAYDIVLNGTEIGGGSVRIHQNDVQEKMFEMLGFTKEQAHERFGFLLDAFKYGVPPHAGLAYGLDRLVMLMAKEDSIRDVIAFPKVKDASCLMTEAPSPVDAAQLEELGLEVEPQAEEETTEE